MINRNWFTASNGIKEIFHIQSPMWPVALCVIGLSALLGLAAPFLLAHQWMVPLLAGLGGLVIGILVLVHPVAGIFLLVLTTNTVRFEIGTGTKTNINLPFLLAGLLVGGWFVRIVSDRSARIHKTPLNLPALLLTAAFGISLFAGRISWNVHVIDLTALEVQLAQVALVWVSLGLMLMVGNTLGEKQLKQLVGLFLVLGAAEAVNAYLARFGAPNLFSNVRGSLLTWLAVIPFGLALCDDRFSLGWRIALGLLALAWLGNGLIFDTHTASTWAPIVVGLVAIVFLYSRKLFFILLGLVAVVAVLFPQIILKPIQLAADRPAYNRIGLGIRTLDLGMSSPLIGLGPASYRAYVLTYMNYDSEIFSGIAMTNWRNSSHNQYIDMFAEAGLIGLLAYLWLMAAAVLFAWWKYRKARTGFQRGYSLAVFGGCVAMAPIGVIGDWVIPLVYNIGYRGFPTSVFIWVFIGGLVALDDRAEKSPPKVDP